MNRNTRTVIVLGVATVVALLASFGVYQAIRSIPERRVEIATTFAVVAAAELPVGTLLTKDSVKLVAWPAQTPLQGGFSNVDEVVNRGLIATVVENEPLSESKLAAKDTGAGLPPSITPGMRAISVKVNDLAPGRWRTLPWDALVAFLACLVVGATAAVPAQRAAVARNRRWLLVVMAALLLSAIAIGVALAL